MRRGARSRAGRGLGARAGAAALLAGLTVCGGAFAEEAHAPAAGGHAAAGEAHGAPAPSLPAVDEATAEAVRRPAAEAHDAAPMPAAEAGHGEAAHDEAGGNDEAAPWPTERAPMPFEIVRSLEFLQDQIARGNVQAMRAQQSVLDRFAPAFLAADPAVWKDPRNLRAAIVFTMSGGPPSVLRGVGARAEIGGVDRALVDAALAYVENRTHEATRRLKAIDLDVLEPALAAQASLARAQLLESEEPKTALADIARVRLLMPGTLIEEAALRMGVGIAEANGDQRLADTLARRYFDAYARSAYAGNFRARFAAAYAERGRDGGIEVLATIRDVTHALPDEERLGIFLSVGRRALVMGNEALAAAICDDALLVSEMAAPDRERAKLYRAAATVATRTVSEARATLEAIDRSLLHPADVEILDAALAVVGGMATPVAAMAAADPPGDRAEAPDPTELAETAAALAAPDAPESQVLARGTQLLDLISNDLQNTSR